LMTMGVTAGLASGLTLLTVFLTMGLSPVNMALVMMLLVGAGGVALVSNALRLPRWDRAREGHMEYIAGRVRALVEAPPQSEAAET